MRGAEARELALKALGIATARVLVAAAVVVAQGRVL